MKVELKSYQVGRFHAAVRQAYNKQQYEVHVSNNSFSSLWMTPEETLALVEVLPGLAEQARQLNEGLSGTGSSSL